MDDLSGMTGRAPDAGLPLGRRRMAIVAVLTAMSLVVLDAGMTTVALPSLSRALYVTPAATVLVITAYQAALIMALLPCAALGERFGQRRVFAGGVALFTAASLLCALSPSLPWLVAARFVQGLGGAAVMALGVALLRSAVPGNMFGAAIGWNALTVALSSAAAPTLGAFTVESLGWTWLYLVNLPLGVLVLVAAQALPIAHRSRQPIDAVSVALNGATFALLVVAAELLVERWIASVFLAATGLLTLLALVSRERPKLAPMIPLDLLANRSFRTSVIASVCCFTGQTAGLVALPFYFQNVLGQTPVITGLYMTAWPLSVAIAVLATRRIGDRLSSGCLCAVGGGLLSLGLAAAALWPLEGAPQPLILCVILCGSGFGLFQVSNNRSMFESAPIARSGAAGGLQGTARLGGQTAGALLITLLMTLAPIGVAARIGLGIGAILAMVGAAVSAIRSSAARGHGPLAVEVGE